MSATRTRLQEKEELQQINHRFVAYIEKVHSQGNERDQLETELHTQESEAEKKIDSLRNAYKTELSDVRVLLDDTAKEKARYQLLVNRQSKELHALEEKFKKAQEEAQKLRQELENARQEIDNLECRFKAAITNRGKAEQQSKELKGELTKLTAQVKSLEAALEHQIVSATDLRNQVQTHKEELDFKTRLHETEVSTMRRQIEELHTKLENSKGDEEFAESLKAAIDEMWEKIKLETEQYRSELERSYESKVETLESQTANYSAVVSSLNDQIADLNASAGDSKAEVARLKKMNDELHQELQMKEEHFAQLKSRHSEELQQCNETMRIQREKFEAETCKYKEVIGLRLKLEQEIKTLDSLLREEEVRLKITPKPRSRPRGGTGNEPSSKRSKQSENLVSTTMGAIDIHVDPDGQFIQLRNTTNEAVRLGQYEVVEEDESKGEKTQFKFHHSSKLQGGASLTLWASDAEEAIHNPPTDYICNTCKKWGTSTKTVISLCTVSNGEVVARFKRQPMAEDAAATQTGWNWCVIV